MEGVLVVGYTFEWGVPSKVYLRSIQGTVQVGVVCGRVGWFGVWEGGCTIRWCRGRVGRGVWSECVVFGMGIRYLCRR